MNRTILIGCLGLVLTLMACSRPISKFSYQEKSYKAPSLVSFENASKNADSYLWSFGDGGQSKDENPKHRFYSSGNYTVTLIAKKDGKEDIFQKEIQINSPQKCLIEMTTNYGVMIIELFDETPKHRDNFIKLVEEGFYDDLLFHRVISGFMIQGGDPDSKGAPAGKRLGNGGPGYTVPAEFVDTLLHVKGALAAARQSDNVNPKKASSGSQFYIVQGKPISEDMLTNISARNGIRYTTEQKEIYQQIGGTPQLDGEYTVFGRVIKGLEVIDKIANTNTDRMNRPSQDVIMQIKIIK